MYIYIYSYREIDKVCMYVCLVISYVYTNEHSRACSENVPEKKLVFLFCVCTYMVVIHTQFCLHLSMTWTSLRGIFQGWAAETSFGQRCRRQPERYVSELQENSDRHVDIISRLCMTCRKLVFMGFFFLFPIWLQMRIMTHHCMWVVNEHFFACFSPGVTSSSFLGKSTSIHLLRHPHVYLTFIF